MEHADVIVVGMGTCGEDIGLTLATSGLDVVGIENLVAMVRRVHRRKVSGA